MHKIIRCLYGIRLLSIFICVLMSNAITISAGEKNQETVEFEYTFKINTISHSGVYSGETLNGYPHGIGRFATDESSTYSYIYEGEFEYGKFDGDGIVYLTDGSYLECKFAEGLPTGRGNIYYTDGTYRGIRFSKGIPFGITATYSEDSELLDYDFYYDGEAIKVLKESAISYEYSGLYKNEKAYIGKILKVDCIVKNVYEGPKECIFKVEDKDGNIYWGKYGNGEHRKYNQSIMPTLKEGDELQLYAFYYGLTKYAAPNDLMYSQGVYPELKAIQGNTKDFCVNRENPSFDYDEVLRFPYSYYKKINNVTGTISNIMKNGNEVLYQLCDENNNIYVVSVGDNLEEMTMGVPGDKVTVKGEYLGLYKVAQEDLEEYKIYVYLEAKKIIN